MSRSPHSGIAAATDAIALPNSRASAWPLFIEWKPSRFNQSDQFIQSQCRILPDFVRVSVACGVQFELFQIKHTIGKVCVHQHVDIEIDITKYVAVKSWWDVDVEV